MSVEENNNEVDLEDRVVEKLHARLVAEFKAQGAASKGLLFVGGLAYGNNSSS